VATARILLVDDYPDALEMWGLFLRSMGYDVVTAADGLVALEEVHRSRPDIVILDLDLPGITGFEAAERLRAAPDTAHIPLIAATCFSHATQLELARRCGFDSILVKPCEPMALLAEVRRFLVGEDPGDFGPHAKADQDQNKSRIYGNPLGQNL
jgi:two-component system cell cycle response regulator